MPGISPGDYVVLSVCDHGVGMNVDNVGRIFEPFFSTKGMDGGVGMGLAIVYGIVKSHHGYVHVDTSPGNGSCFSVFLSKSVVVKTEDSSDYADEVVHGPSHPLSVLVVDDDPQVRQVLGKMVRAIGHDCAEADGMDTAMTRLGDQTALVDLVVSDVLMPHGSGFELVEAVRRQWPALPVLLCTGVEAPEMHQRLRNWSGVNLLPKPFTIEALRNAIEALSASTTEGGVLNA